MTGPSADVVSRVAFSYESMMYAAEWLVWREDDETQEPGLWNAHVDSFLVHARRLYDVLLDKGRDEDDLILSDLIDQLPKITLPRTGEFRTRMNKRILHLTTSDDPEAVKWPVAAISRELAKAMDQVIDAMAASGSEYYERFMRARDGQPGFRKLVM